MQSQEANKTTRRSARRSVVENSLTEPTLLEMSGNATNQELTNNFRWLANVLPGSFKAQCNRTPEPLHILKAQRVSPSQFWSRY